MPGWNVDHQILNLVIRNSLEMLGHRIDVPVGQEWFRRPHYAHEYSTNLRKRRLAISPRRLVSVGSGLENSLELFELLIREAGEVVAVIAGFCLDLQRLRRWPETDQEILYGPGFAAARGFPEKPCRFVGSALSCNCLHKRPFELDARQRLARGVSRLSRLKSGRVARCELFRRVS